MSFSPSASASNNGQLVDATQLVEAEPQADGSLQLKGTPIGGQASSAGTSILNFPNPHTVAFACRWLHEQIVSFPNSNVAREIESTEGVRSNTLVSYEKPLRTVTVTHDEDGNEHETVEETAAIVTIGTSPGNTLRLLRSTFFDLANLGDDEATLGALQRLGL